MGERFTRCGLLDGVSAPIDKNPLVGVPLLSSADTSVVNRSSLFVRATSGMTWERFLRKKVP